MCAILCSFYNVVPCFLFGNLLIQLLSGNTDKQMKLSVDQMAQNMSCGVFDLSHYERYFYCCFASWPFSS